MKMLLIIDVEIEIGKKSCCIMDKISTSISSINEINETNAPTGRVDRNWTKSGGKASQPRFLLVGEVVQVPHYPDSSGWLSPPHLPLSGVRSDQRAQAPVATAA